MSIFYFILGLDFKVKLKFRSFIPNDSFLKCFCVFNFLNAPPYIIYKLEMEDKTCEIKNLVTT